MLYYKKKGTNHMNIIGIIAEYNPLHLGHIYQIKKIKELYPNSIIILITNSCFTQRGDICILNKKNKTQLALEHDIDLIVELPFAYATQSADIFAKGALEILNHLKINTLAFGSESNNLKKLTTIANTQLNNPQYNILVKKYLSEGINYPTALSKALTELIGYTTNEPNDLLGISYIKEILKNNYNIKPILIKRIGSYHSKETKNNIANATLIRKKLLKNEPIKAFLPPNEEHLLTKNLSLNTYFPYLKYKIISTPDLSIYQTVEEGLENRIKKAIKISNTWEELVKNIKTKRYTYNKLNRMLIHILTSFTKEEAKNIEIDYIKILGFSIQGKKYLNQIKKTISIPLISRYKKNISHLLDLELRTTSIYYLPFNSQFINNEYSDKPIIKNSEITDKLHQNHQTKEVL